MSLFQRKSVDNIMSAFYKQLEQLESLSDEKLDEANTLRYESQKLTFKAQDAEAESLHALNVSTRIRALLEE